MNASRASCGLLVAAAAAAACISSPAVAQSPDFDEPPDRLPDGDDRRHAGQRLERHLARHRQAAGLGAAHRAAQPGVARPAVQGPGERAHARRPADGSPPPSLFVRKVEKLAAMGEAESLNEMVRNAGGYADPAVASTVANALMMAGEKDSACPIVRGNKLTEPLRAAPTPPASWWPATPPGAGRAGCARRCKLVETAAEGLPPTGAAACQLDGPAMVTLDLTLRPGAGKRCLRTTQPPLIVRALVGASRRCRSPRGSRSPNAARRWPSSRRPSWATSISRRCATGAALPPAIARRARAWSRRRAVRRIPTRWSEFDRYRLRRGARQPAVPDHRAGECRAR